jgi:hypothetical protein
MTPEEEDRLLARLEAREEKREKTRPITAPKPSGPMALWKKIGFVAGVITAVGGVAWGGWEATIKIAETVAEKVTIPRARAESIHEATEKDIRALQDDTEHLKRHDAKQDKAIRYGFEYSIVVDSNIRKIGQERGIKMDPAPRVDLMADE